MYHIIDDISFCHTHVQCMYVCVFAQLCGQMARVDEYFLDEMTKNYCFEKKTLGANAVKDGT